MTAHTIVSAAIELSEADRVHVIEALLDSLDSTLSDDPQAAMQAWRDEVMKRSQELRMGEVEVIPWPEVAAEGERLFDVRD